MPSRGTRKWKQVKRAKKVWASLAEQCDLDPDDWIVLLDCLGDHGLELNKSKKNKPGNMFIGLITD